MSAYIVGKSHIDAMLRSGMGKGPHYVTWSQSPSTSTDWPKLTIHTADRVGQMLLDECVKSVSHRYPHDTIGELPGPSNAEWLIPYQFHIMGKTPTPVQALKLIRCYEYQSCEHPEWETSEAQAFCEALTAELITNLPGYEGANWEWQEERSNGRPMLLIG